MGLLNSRDFGLPHQRCRLYVAGVRADSLRYKFRWPQPCVAALPDVLSPKGPGDIRGGLHPKDMQKGRSRRLAKQAYRRAMAAGVDPRTTMVAVDVDCSDRYATGQICYIPCLTASRGRSGGPWISNRGRRTTVSELFRFQGIPEAAIDWVGAGLSPRHIGVLEG